MPYPERQPAPESLPDRWISAAGFALHRALRRRLRGGPALARRVHARAAELRGIDLASLVAPLRYRMRREGLGEAVLAEAFALYCAALGEEALPGAEVLAAAAWVARGGLAELAAPGERTSAVALAAFARALHVSPVHAVTASERAAQALSAALGPAFGRLGLPTACVAAGMDEAARRAAYAAPVACAAHREIGLDYLRDRVQFGGTPGSLRNRLERIAGGERARRAPVLGGLRSALVLDADLVLVDDTRAPLMIARDVDQSQERLMYEQAMELARALAPERDFYVDEGVPRLTQAAAALLDRLVTPLGGLWAARERRNQLVGLALHALHVLERDVHYRVERDRVVLPERSREDAEAAAAEDAVLLMLLEVKEGCRTSQRREVLARLSVPAFFSRYLQLGGICADARRLESELWRLYRLRTARAGRPVARPAVHATVFAAAAGKLAALVERARGAAPNAMLIAVRTPAAAQAIEKALAASGIPASTARGRGDELDRRALAPLEQPGGVALALYPAQVPARAPGAPPLRLVVAELHDAERHVAHLASSCGAASVETLLALEDEAVRGALGGWLGPVAALGAGPLARAAQRGAERAQALLRQDLAAREQHLQDLLAFSGERQ